MLQVHFISERWKQRVQVEIESNTEKLKFQTCHVTKTFSHCEKLKAEFACQAISKRATNRIQTKWTKKKKEHTHTHKTTTLPLYQLEQSMNKKRHWYVKEASASEKQFVKWSALPSMKSSIEYKEVFIDMSVANLLIYWSGRAWFMYFQFRCEST